MERVLRILKKVLKILLYITIAVVAFILAATETFRYLLIWEFLFAPK